MCGITGIYNLNNSRQNKTDNSNIILKMTNAIVHRGPDDCGYFVDDNIALGHRRLSILDLSPLGHQPMTYGDLMIVFNGEIYNYIEIREELRKLGYKFRSQSDTEVIMASYKQWGNKCLNKFNGMWAFAIFDSKKNKLFLSRDRFGVKPLYYCINKDKLIFASEIKAILAYPGISARPNDHIIWDYLVGGVVGHTNDTFFNGIKSFPPGSYAEVDLNWLKNNKNKNFKFKKFWDLKNIQIDHRISRKDAIDNFRTLFIDAVRIRLRSDVPIGTCLSGGLDSSAIVGAVNRLLQDEAKISQTHSKQKTFSACYRGVGASTADEGTFIKEVLKKTKVRSYFVYPSGKNLVKEIKSLCYHQEEPFVSTSIYAQRKVFNLAKNYVKVVLDGQGSDELLGGYHVFFMMYFKDLLYQKKIKQFYNEITKYSHNQKMNSLKVIINFFIKYYFIALVKKHLRIPDFFLKSEYNIFQPMWLKKYSLYLKQQKKHDNFRSKSYESLVHKNLPSYLRYEDRNSMAFAIESRLPFLDYRLAEFIFSLPNDLKIRDGQTKWILREALGDLLPLKIKNRHDKKGFAVPEIYWMKNDLANSMFAVFSSASIEKRGYFRYGKVLELYQKFLKGENNNYKLLWRLFNLEIWFRIFIDKKTK